MSQQLLIKIGNFNGLIQSSQTESTIPAEAVQVPMVLREKLGACETL